MSLFPAYRLQEDTKSLKWTAQQEAGASARIFCSLEFWLIYGFMLIYAAEAYEHHSSEIRTDRKLFDIYKSSELFHQVHCLHKYILIWKYTKIIKQQILLQLFFKLSFSWPLDKLILYLPQLLMSVVIRLKRVEAI